MAEPRTPDKRKPARRAELTDEERAELDLALEEEREGPTLPENLAEAAESIETAAGPRWWWYAGVAVLVVIAILIAISQGNRGASTDVQPGTPISGPATR